MFALLGKVIRVLLGLFKPSSSSFYDQFRDWLDPGQDDIWAEWVDLENPNFRSLEELALNRSKRKEFRARALIVLLAPDIKEIPVYWKEESPLIRGNAINLESLPEEFLEFVAQLVIYAQEKLEHKQAYVLALYACSQYLRQLLKLLPVDKAELVWVNYDINDPVPYRSGDSESGYNPWGKLMDCPEIPLHWKILADGRLRNIIDHELAGKKLARVSHESAFAKYCEQINFLIYRCRKEQQFPYDISLLASQLEYMLAKAAVYKEYEVVPRFNIGTILKLLDSENYKELRLWLIRFSINTTRFNVDAETARVMLQTLDPGDSNAKILQEIIIEEEQRAVRQQSEDDEYCRRVKELDNRMRI